MSAAFRPASSATSTAAHSGSRSGRVYRSLDGGDSWHGYDAGLPTGCYQSILRGAMAVAPGSPCGVYFGTASGTVYGSRDAGESWTELVTGLPRILSVEAYEVE